MKQAKYSGDTSACSTVSAQDTDNTPTPKGTEWIEDTFRQLSPDMRKIMSRMIKAASSKDVQTLKACKSQLPEHAHTVMDEIIQMAEQDADNTPTPETESDEWKKDLFEPALTVEQLRQAENGINADYTNQKIMLLTLTKTPMELLEIGRENLEAYEALSLAVDNYIRFTEYSLDAAKSAQSRLAITTSKLLQEVSK